RPGRLAIVRTELNSSATMTRTLASSRGRRRSRNTAPTASAASTAAAARTTARPDTEITPDRFSPAAAATGESRTNAETSWTVCATDTVPTEAALPRPARRRYCTLTAAPPRAAGETRRATVPAACAPYVGQN